MLTCGSCQEMVRSIRFFELRRSLRRLHQWHANQVRSLVKFFDRHKEINLLSFLAQVLVLLTGVYMMNVQLVVHSSNAVPVPTPVASADVVRAIIEASPDRALLQRIDSLQIEVAHIKRMNNWNKRASLLAELRRMPVSDSTESQYQAARAVSFVPNCVTPADRQNSLWCLPAKEIRHRQEAIDQYLRSYRAFLAERESFAQYNREHLPRGSAQSYLSLQSDTTAPSYSSLSSSHRH